MLPEVKIGIVGAGGVGKTCFCLRLTRNTFDSAYVPTISDQFEGTVQHNDNPVKIIINDTSGQDELGYITSLVVRDSQVFILMYSVTSQMSFDELDKFYGKIADPDNSSVIPKVVLVGNKCDLETGRVISKEQGEEKARLLNAKFFECSAIVDPDGINIKEAVDAAITMVMPDDGTDAQQGEGGGGCCEVA